MIWAEALRDWFAGTPGYHAHWRWYCRYSDAAMLLLLVAVIGVIFGAGVIVGLVIGCG